MYLSLALNDLKALYPERNILIVANIIYASVQTLHTVPYFDNCCLLTCRLVSSTLYSSVIVVL
jgi:hypothetical protein